jgi:hypothetical protein
VKTYWHCEKCGGTGRVTHLKRAGVMEVVKLIRDQHETHRRAVCEFNNFNVRVGERSMRARTGVTVTPPLSGD